MTSVRILTAGLILALTGTAAVAQQPKQLEMEPVTIVDPMVGNVPAVTFLKPKGWQVSGGVQWYLNSIHQACLEVKVANPKGLEQFEALPWTICLWAPSRAIPLVRGANHSGYCVMEPMSPRQVIEQHSLKVLPGRQGARIVSYTELPGKAILPAAKFGIKVKSSKTRIEYRVNGALVEEDIYLTLFYWEFQIGAEARTIWGAAENPFSLRAAKGQLDAATPMLMSIRHSAVVTPRWLKEYETVWRLFLWRMGNAAANEMALSTTIRWNSDYIRTLIREAHKTRQAGVDRAMANFSDYIRGQQLYGAAGVTSLVLPSGYRHAWTRGDRAVILSDDPNYNPNVNGKVTGTWTRLDPISR